MTITARTTVRRSPLYLPFTRFTTNSVRYPNFGKRKIRIVYIVVNTSVRIDLCLSPDLFHRIFTFCSHVDEKQWRRVRRNQGRWKIRKSYTKTRKFQNSNWHYIENTERLRTLAVIEVLKNVKKCQFCIQRAKMYLSQVEIIKLCTFNSLVWVNFRYCSCPIHFSVFCFFFRFIYLYAWP